jgi:hypothetical protein
MDTQSNTRVGDLQAVALEELTGKEGRLVLLSIDDDVVGCQLPDALTNRVPYVLVEGGAATESCRIRPMDPSQNVRLYLAGASVVPGDALALADHSGDATKQGKVNKLPTGAGTYRVVAIAEEEADAGALVLCRPFGEVVVVAGQQ